ncbi:MAG: aminotransferase class I/II-fold pyridoxal phosphate-dependent enzyme [Candidatus Theseobacter exili]|nr:aminotransferase class I/II-fold pyridoxal phosphate-dependent enzyme [Candidatus Theseobacter exili]
MDCISNRMNKIDASGIRKVFDLAKDMKNPVNLSIGQPDFDIPDHLKDKAIEAIKKGHNTYTLTQGIPELRTEVRNHLEKRRINPEEILITSGVSGGILLSLFAIINPGDEIIIPDPYFVMYKHLVNLLDGKPVFIDTYPDFRFTAKRIAPKITSKTKAILLNSPANPTGVALDNNDLQELANLAEKHSLLVISDEIYSPFSYDSHHKSIAEFYDKTLVLDGFSKSHAMTGWRLGYAAGPAELINQMTKVQQYTFVCAPSIAQKVGVEALKSHVMQGYIDAYREKREIIVQGLLEKFEFTVPNGTFYIFPKAPGGDGEAFVMEAIRNNLLIIPGNVFSEKNTHFRISFAAKNETLQKGIEILNRIADKI